MTLEKNKVFSVKILFVLSALFVVLWSSGFIGAKFALGDAGTFTLLLGRYILVTIVMAILVTAMGSWQKISSSVLLTHAVIGILAHAVWLVTVLGAIDLGVSAGLAAFITALQPLVTGLLSARLTGERISRREWIGLFLGLASVVFVIGGQINLGTSAVGLMLPVIAVIGISIGTLIDRRILSKQVQQVPIVLTIFIHTFASTLFLFPFAWLIEGFAFNLTSNLVISVLWLGLVVSLAAYGLMFALLRHMPAAKVASLTYLSPPVTVFLGYFAFGEYLSATDIIGFLIAAFAIFLILMRRNVQMPTSSIVESN